MGDSADRIRARVLAVLPDGQDVELGVLDPDARCDLGLVEDLARLQLAARRLGGAIRLTDVAGDLQQLTVLVGLADELSVEVVGEAEGGEQRRVDEAVDPGDAPV